MTLATTRVTSRAFAANLMHMTSWHGYGLHSIAPIIGFVVATHRLLVVRALTGGVIVNEHRNNDYALCFKNESKIKLELTSTIIHEVHSVVNDAVVL
jgi:hypothetical protein